MRETEPIDRDALCWLGLEFSEEHIPAASPYGDPEAAMMFREDPPEEEPEIDPADRELMTELLGLLAPIDRIIFALASQERSQSQIAELVKRSQPSVCIKLQRIRRWVSIVFPLRRALRDDVAPLPDAWEAHPERRHYWQTIVSTHAPATRIARAGVYGVRLGERGLADLIEQGSEAQRAIATMLLHPKHGRDWTRPAPGWVELPPLVRPARARAIAEPPRPGRGVWGV